MSLYDTHTMLEVLDGLPTFEPLLLQKFFPNIALFETDLISFDALDIDESRKLAPFVSPLVAGQVRKNQGGEVRSFKPAYIKPKHVVDPGRLLMRLPGETLNGTMSPALRRDAIIAANLQLERDQILRRLEWMAAQSLRTGKVIVAGEDYPSQEVDFRRKSTLTKTLTTTARWSEKTTADPLVDIEAWDAELEAPSTDIIFNKVAWKYFSANEDVRKMYELWRGSASVAEFAPGTGTGVQAKGQIGAKRMWLYTGNYLTDDGVEVEYLPTGEVILTSADVQGVRAFGAILDPAAGYQALEYFPKNWVSDDPAAEFTMTQAAPLVIPRRPNASMCVKVTDATS